MRSINTTKVVIEKTFSQFVGLIFVSLGLLALSACKSKLEAPKLENASAQAYIQNVSITTLSFNNTGGDDLTNCSASSLPAGLSIAKATNNKTCEITGTPTTEQVATIYTITAVNIIGSDTATVSIEVKTPIPPLALPELENAVAQQYTKDVAITSLVFSNTGGEELTSCSADSLPVGLSVAKSVDSKTCEITGTPTDAQDSTIHTITAVNATGSGTALVNIEIALNNENTIELIKDLQPLFSSGSYPQQLTKVNNILYFLTNTPHNIGTDLWKSGGTEASTVKLKSFPIALTEDTRLVAVGDTLFFNIDEDGTKGLELWKSNGTPESTVLVRHLNVGGRESVSKLTAFGDEVFFMGFEVNTGFELWKSDGTALGTLLVRNINSDAQGVVNNSYPSNLTVMGDTLYFSASDYSVDPNTGEVKGNDIWKTKGTQATTVIVNDLPYSYDANIDNFTVVGSNLFFSAPYNDNSGYQHGNELWKTDGTNAGTVFIKDINTNAINSYTNQNAFSFTTKSYFTAVGQTLFFVAYDGAQPNEGHGWELWKSDGTANGTLLVKDILTIGSHGSAPEDLTSMGGILFFTAVDDTHGRELWKSNGILAETALLKDTLVNGDGLISSLNFLRAAGGKLYFSSIDALWVSDGTTQGTVNISGQEIQEVREKISIGNILYFSAKDDMHGQELWKLNLQ